MRTSTAIPLLDAKFLRAQKPIALAPAAPLIRFVDLFSGAGGLSLGMSAAARALGHRTEATLAIEAVMTGRIGVCYSPHP